MGNDSRRWQRRLSIVAVLLLALLVAWAVAIHVVLPRAIETIVDRSARKAGFPAVRVSGVRLDGFGIAVQRVDLAPEQQDEQDEESVLRLEEIVVELGLDSAWRGRAEAIRIGSVVLETDIQGTSIAIPGHRPPEPAAGAEEDRPMESADVIDPESLPLDRLEVERARFVLKPSVGDERPAGEATALVEGLRAGLSDGAMTASAEYQLALPSAAVSGTVDVVWSGGDSRSAATLQVEEGAAEARGWVVEALSGEARLLWSGEAPPEASFSLDAARTRLRGVSLGALALAGRWREERGALRLESRSDGPIALSLELEAESGERRQGSSGDAQSDGSSRVRIDGSGRVRIADLAVVAGAKASGHASLELGFEGAWPATDRDGAAGASGRFRLLGTELAWEGRARAGRISVEGQIDATPSRIEIVATAPWTARATPVEGALPSVAAAFEGEALDLSFEPERAVLESRSGGGSGIEGENENDTEVVHENERETYEGRLTGRLAAESANGARLVLTMREAWISQGASRKAAGRATAEIGSLSLSAQAIPLADFVLGAQAYHGQLQYENGRTRLVGQGRLLFEGGASGFALAGGSIDWSGAVVGDAARIELRPDRCLVLEIGAAHRAGLRIEGARWPCIESRNGAPLLAYHLEETLLELGLSAPSSPLSLEIFREAEVVADVQGTWPESELDLRLRGGTPQAGEARMTGGRAQISPGGLELAGIEATATIEKAALREARLGVREILSTRAPPLWAPLRLDFDAGQPAAAEPIRFRATLSDALGTFILEASGEQREGGRGQADWKLHPVRFIPEATEIGDLSPWLAIWLRDLTGGVGFEGSTRWSAAGLRSEGSLRLNDLALSLSQVSISGLDGQVELMSLWPPRTAGRQKIEIASIDAGVPLTAGELFFQLQPGPALLVHELRFQMAGGQLMADPFRVDASDPAPLRVELRARDVALSQLIEISGIEGLRGQGRLSGEIPLVLSPEGLRLAGGRLDTRGDGQLRYTPEELPAFLKGDELRRRMLREALENYRYETLALAVSGEIGDEQKIRLTARGRNPSFLDGHPVELDVSMQGPLVSVLRSMIRPYHAGGDSKSANPDQSQEESEP